MRFIAFPSLKTPPVIKLDRAPDANTVASQRVTENVSRIAALFSFTFVAADY